jgi:hypothetical protein
LREVVKLLLNLSTELAGIIDDSYIIEQVEVEDEINQQKEEHAD